MRTITKTLYKLNELPEDVQQDAIDKFRECNLDYEWWDFVYEDTATIAELFGLDIRTRRVKLMDGTFRYDPNIYFSGFSSQGDGACFEGTYQYKKGALKAVKEYAPQDKELHNIVKDLQDVQRKYFYNITATTKQSGHYCHEGCMQVDCEYENPQSYYSDELTVPDEEDLTQALRNFARWIYKRLEDEYDWLQSDEQIRETILCNDYYFDEYGNF